MGDSGKHNRSKIRGWIYGYLILLSSLAISFLIPPVAPVLGVALIVGGVVAYRQNTETVIRNAGVAAIIAGGAIVLTLVLIGGLLTAVRGESTHYQRESVDTEVP